MGCGYENSLAVEVVQKFTAEFGENEKVAVNDRIQINKIYVCTFFFIRHRQVMLKIKTTTSRVSWNTRFYGSCIHLVYDHPYDVTVVLGLATERLQ